MMPQWHHHCVRSLVESKQNNTVFSSYSYDWYTFIRIFEVVKAGFEI